MTTALHGHRDRHLDCVRPHRGAARVRHPDLPEPLPPPPPIQSIPLPSPSQFVPPPPIASLPCRLLALSPACNSPRRRRRCRPGPSRLAPRVGWRSTAQPQAPELLGDRADRRVHDASAPLGTALLRRSKRRATRAVAPSPRTTGPVSRSAKVTAEGVRRGVSPPPGGCPRYGSPPALRRAQSTEFRLG